VSLNYVNHGEYGSNIGSRLYAMEGDTYKMFHLKNREFTIDVDVSSLPCGLNGALYFVQMEANGGMGVGNNQAGAKYGTGYCDAQCPKVKWINGEANVGLQSGACCSEMDIFEGNQNDVQIAAHPCATAGPTKCDGMDCGSVGKGWRYQGMCDKDGCDYNTYRMGDRGFWGPGKTVDSNRPVTVVTQFITADGTDGGPLSEIRRFYVQDNKVIKNQKSYVPNLQGDSLTDGFCSAMKAEFASSRVEGNPNGDYDQFTAKGGMQAMGNAFDHGMVLVLSLWDDHTSKMLWLTQNHQLTVRTPSLGSHVARVLQTLGIQISCGHQTLMLMSCSRTSNLAPSAQPDLTLTRLSCQRPLIA